MPRANEEDSEANRVSHGARRLTCAFVDRHHFAQRDVAVGLDVVAGFHAHLVREDNLVGDAAGKVVGTHGSP